MFGSPNASTADDELTSGLDLGGEKRTELRARVQALQEQAQLKNLQLEELQQLQKRSARDALIDGRRRAALAPVLSAWGRAVAAARAERAGAALRQQLLREQEEQHVAALARAAAKADEKEQQAAGLLERIARIKGNAQAKLAELNDANKRLQAALADKESARAAADAAVAKRAQRELDDLKEKVRVADASLQAAEAARAEAAAAAKARERRLDGFEAEVACLKAEAAAQATIAKAQGFGGGGGGAPTGWTHGAPAVTAADLTLSSYKRALLVAAFGRWCDRLAYRRQLGVEREGAEARLAAGRWEAEAVAERATTAQLRAALADAETQAGAQAARASELEGALARSEAARAAQRKRLFATADGARSLEAQLREIMGAQRALGEEAAAAAAEADDAGAAAVSVKLDALSASAVRLSVDYDDGADGLGPPPAAPPPPPP